MNTDKHVVTIPIADYNQLISNQKPDDLIEIKEGNKDYEIFKRGILNVHLHKFLSNPQQAEKHYQDWLENTQVFIKKKK